METQEEILSRLERKIDAVYTSTEKSRKYLLTILIATVVMVILPLILGALMPPHGTQYIRKYVPDLIRVRLESILYINYTFRVTNMRHSPGLFCILQWLQETSPYRSQYRPQHFLCYRSYVV